MEACCRNCKYFTQVSLNYMEHAWGDCRKPADGTEQTGDEIKGVFKWGKGTCPDFKPKQNQEPEAG